MAETANLGLTLLEVGQMGKEAVTNGNMEIIDDAIGSPVVDAKADGSTKGIAAFVAADFNDDGAGLISLDYTNGQAADSTHKGYLTASDWNAFSSMAGMSGHESCRVATTANLTATYSNGASGVGATLTNSSTLAAISIDGVSLSSSDRVLVKDQSTPAQNGIYTVTTVGSGAVAWVLTRATDFDEASEITMGAYVVITAGTANAGTIWIESGMGPWTMGTTAITFTQLNGNVPTASTTMAGKVELATAAETTTGTDATRAVTPDSLAHSNYGRFPISMLISDPLGNAITTGDGKGYARIPSIINGWNLVAVAIAVSTVSSSGLPTVQLRRVRAGSPADMLSTKVSIDANEEDSSTAATPAVIDTSNDDVQTGDKIYFDIDVAGTGAKGLTVEMQFQLP